MNLGRIVELDVAEVVTSEELQDRIAAAFGFPSYYRRNWESFCDCIMRMCPPPSLIHVTGIDDLTRVLPQEGALLEHCLLDLSAEPDLQDLDIQWK